MSADLEADGTLQLLERKRLQLESQIAELEKQLLHWQSWETDYELFKEEITALPDSDNEQKLPTSVEEFDRDFLNSQEVKKILSDGKGGRRTRLQVLDVLRHRLDYVRGNVDSITKRRDAVDEKIRAVDVLIQPDMTDEDGLPLTEITEELDEDDNVISSSVRDTTGDSEALMSKLESEGLAESGEHQGKGQSQPNSDSTGSTTQENADQNASSQASSQRAATAEALARAKAKQLADDLKEEDDGVDGDAVLSMTRLLGSIADLDAASGTELGPGLKIKDPSAFKQVPGRRSAEHPDLVEPVVPTDESAEDAALRREMLEYSLGEVGQIVAEMNLDGEHDEDYDDDDDDDDDEEYGKFNFDDLNEEDEDDDEDEYGRARRPMISEDYRKQMLDLEKQLGAKALQNVGPAPGRISPPTSDEEDEPAVATEPVSKAISEPEASKTVSEPASVPAPALKTKKSGKSKGVRFAEGLDIAEETESAPAPPKASTETLEPSKKSKVPAVNPLADEIQERKTPARINVAGGTSTRKPSRFKAAKSAEGPATSAELTVAKTAPRGPLAGPLLDNLKPIRDERAERFAGPLLSMTAEKPRYTPEGPPGKTIGDVWERDPAAPNPHFVVDDDAGLTRQALAMEYYKERNKKIYQQGGFVAEEPEIIPVDENGEELRPKVSRFRAARLKRTDQ